MNEMDVLVTGGEEKQGLTVARSLGKRGLKVLLGGSEKSSIGFYSKYAKKTFLYPSPYVNMDFFVDEIILQVKKYSIPLVFPAIESTLVCLDRYRESLDKVTRLAAPSSETLHKAIDKTQTMQLAESLKIPVPRTKQVETLEEALIAGNELGYPIAMKPQGSRFHKNLPGKLQFKVAYANSENELKLKLTELCKEGVYPLLQEFCKGEGVCVAAVAFEGKPLTLFQYKRSRELPLTGGVSVVRESMNLDPRVRDYCIRLLESMKWTGPAMVEFKYNPFDNKYTLMEINSRIQSSIALAYHAGVDIPYIVYELFMNGKNIHVDDYRIGVRCRWLRGDIASFKKFISGDTARSFVNIYHYQLPTKSELFWEFIKDFRPGMKYDIESLNDPIPGIIETKNILKEQARSLFHKLIKR